MCKSGVKAALFLHAFLSIVYIKTIEIHECVC
jgi:hypothetical protein